ncbi:DUF177 domain-containing protein [Pedobacter sp. HMF7056]|uniref:DUF177 domain-containing protein n=1 Tax=Hufsiella ginkgonis TaxID=2695274 RepID=A0A7K1Y151_9SPHI|nr:DUF177 domain-containing protein [Hufsiella ginkgonis]
MKSLQQYRIPFTGLKIGKHQFGYELDERFFAEFEYSLVKNGKLTVLLEMEKQETMLILSFTIKGIIFLSCDVCLADYPYPVEIAERQIAKFGSSEEDDMDEIIILGRNDHEIDISTLLYEYVNVAVPYINRCADEGNTEWCDKEMISRLESLAPKEESDETTENTADPRWEALKKIKNN